MVVNYEPKHKIKMAQPFYASSYFKTANHTMEHSHLTCNSSDDLPRVGRFHHAQLANPLLDKVCIQLPPPSSIHATIRCKFRILRAKGKYCCCLVKTMSQPKATNQHGSMNVYAASWIMVRYNQETWWLSAEQFSGIIDCIVSFAHRFRRRRPTRTIRQAQQLSSPRLPGWNPHFPDYWSESDKVLGRNHFALFAL